MDEDKARKYCLMFCKHPSSTVSQIYRDCTTESIHTLSCILSEWCYLASENQLTMLDTKIPMSYLQLYQFAQEIGSSSKNPKIVCARCRTTLCSQSPSKETLHSLAKILRVSDGTCEIRFYRAIVEARLGDLQIAVQDFINGVMSNNDLDELFCILFSFNLEDLEKMKSLLLSLSTSTQLDNELEAGLTNQGFIEDNDSISSGIGSSVVSLEIDQQKEKYILKDIRRSVETLDSVIQCKTGKGSSTIEQASKLANKGYIYRAMSLLIDNVMDHTVMEGIHEINESVRHGLFEFCHSVASNLLAMYCEREQNVFRGEEQGISVSRGNDALWNDEMILVRGLSYSRLGVAIIPSNVKAIDLLVRFLVKSDQRVEAIEICKSNLQSNTECTSLRLSLAWCYLYDNRIEETITELNFISFDPGVIEAYCLKVILKLLEENCEFPFNDLSIACKDHLHDMIETACFVGKERLMKIKSNVRQMIAIHLSSFTYLDNPVSTGTNEEGSKLDESSKGDSSTNTQDTNDSINRNKDNCLDSIWQGYKPIITFLTSLFSFDLEIHLLCTEVLLVLKKYDDAQQCLIDLVKKAPKDLLTIVHLANLRMRLGAYVAATEDFRLLLQALGPSRLAAYFLHLSDNDRREIARVHRQHAFKFLRKQCLYADAIECFTIAITAVGTMATGLLLARGICFTYLGHYNSALADFTTILGEDSENVSALMGKIIMVSLGQQQGNLLDDLGLALRLDADTAIKTARKLPLSCVQAFSSFLRKVIKSDLSTHIGNRGDDSKKSLLKLVEYARFFRTLFPKSERDFLVYIECLFHCGRKEDALTELSTAGNVTVSPSVISTWKGVIMHRLQNPKESITAFKEISSKDMKACRKVIDNLRLTERQQLRSISLQSAIEKQKEGFYAEALQLYLVAMVTTRRNDLQIHRGRYECFCELQDRKSAISELDAIIKITSTPEDLCTRSFCYTESGAIDEACKDLMSAMDSDLNRTLLFLKHENQVRIALNVFQSEAQSHFQHENYMQTIKCCEFGLKLSKNDKSLKQLRARARTALSNCCVQ